MLGNLGYKLLSLSLVFHVFAALVFFALGLAIAQLLNEKRYFVKTYQLSTANRGGFLIDWPMVFVSKWCEFVGVKLSGLKERKFGLPVRITPTNWFEFDAKFGIVLVAVEQSQKATALKIETRLDVDNKESWCETLSGVFGGKINIQIKTSE